MNTYRMRDWFFLYVIENNIYQDTLKTKIQMELVIQQISAQLKGKASFTKLDEAYNLYLRSAMPWIDIVAKNEMESLAEEYKKLIQNKKS